MKLVFGVHAHQPVGNPDEIIEKAFDKCYMPFLETLANFPRVKIAFHISGHLMEWALEKREHFIELLKELHKRGNVELLGGGLYEPILSSIPKEDAIDQLKLFSEFIESVFGERPKGAWLTERVWDSFIPSIFKEAGITYTFVDDYHFLCTGLDEENLNGFYHTEHEGYKLYLFPTNQKLRYLIPFRSTSSVSQFLRALNGPGIIFDDYEKFGLWPETYEWVYEKGWLKEFFNIINQGEITTLLPSELLDQGNSLGLVYLPTVSYFEMGEWSLPAKKAFLFKEFTTFLEKENLLQKYKGLVRGGQWKNFFIKYPESNYMQKKMVFISKRIRELPEGPSKEKAKRCLYRAQCNDAYWHGIFGGIYFPHLRESIFKELSRAESLLFGSRTEVFIEDIDLDDSKEIYIYTPQLTCIIKPNLGGSIRELTFHPNHINLVNTLSRKKEHYHMIQRAQNNAKREENSISTIHERIYNLDTDPIEFDLHERTFGYEEVSFDGGKTWVSLISEKFEIESIEGLSFTLRKEIAVSSKKEVAFRKKIELVDNFLKIMYPLIGETPIDLKVFLNVKLTSIDFTSLKIDRKALQVKEENLSEGNEIEIEDKISKTKLLIKANQYSKISIKQIYTFSQTEEGYDRIYQATEITLTPLELKEAFSILFKAEKS